MYEKMRRRGSRSKKLEREDRGRDTEVIWPLRIARSVQGVFSKTPRQSVLLYSGLYCDWKIKDMLQGPSINYGVVL